MPLSELNAGWRRLMLKGAASGLKVTSCVLITPHPWPLEGNTVEWAHYCQQDEHQSRPASKYSLFLWSETNNNNGWWGVKDFFVQNNNNETEVKMSIGMVMLIVSVDSNGCRGRRVQTRSKTASMIAVVMLHCSTQAHVHTVIIAVLFQTKDTQCTVWAFQHVRGIVRFLHRLLSVSHGRKHTKSPYEPYTLHPQCEKPWGPSRVDGLISGCSRENARRQDRRFYIIFLQPTHTSHSPTSDTKLSDRMWLTSFSGGRLNSPCVTLLRWPLSSLTASIFVTNQTVRWLMERISSKRFLSQNKLNHLLQMRYRTVKD